MKKLIIIVVIASGFLFLPGCKERPQQQNKLTQADKARVAAESVNFTENAEIENIKKRLELTSDPGLTGFILLLNQAGQPIMYTGVAGKITSGGKRLTPPIRRWKLDCGQMCNETLNVAPSDEGTWGSSSEYVFFWTTNGQYIQWNGKYLYSDKPFRTNIKPLVIAIDTPIGAANGEKTK